MELSIIIQTLINKTLLFFCNKNSLKNNFWIRNEPSLQGIWSHSPRTLADTFMFACCVANWTAVPPSTSPEVEKWLSGMVWVTQLARQRSSSSSRNFHNLWENKVAPAIFTTQTTSETSFGKWRAESVNRNWAQDHRVWVHLGAFLEWIIPRWGLVYGLCKSHATCANRKVANGLETTLEARHQNKLMRWP